MHRLTATDTPMVRYTRTIFPSYAGDYVGINGRIHSRKYQKDDRVYLNYGFVAEKVDFLR